MPPKSKPVAIYNPFTARSRANQSAQEMYPGKIGQDDQRDAARHMLASGYLAKAWSPGVADLLGKAHEFKETPLRHLGALAGVAQHRYDRPIDIHNNALGIELAQKARDMEEFERLVNEAAERARPVQTPGVPWVPSAKDAEAMRKGSAQYQKGGLVKNALSALKASKKVAPEIVEETIQVLPKKEATKNLAKFVKPSAVKQRVFHGSNIPENIVEDKQFAHYGPDSSEIHWFSESPKHANEYTYKYLESEGDQGAIFPVNLQIRKPLEVPFNMNSRADKSFRDHIRGLGIYPSEIEEWALMNDLSKPSKVWQFVNTPVFREIAKRRGYDGVKAQERDYTTWGAFEPTQIKSQFNRGTYDVQDPDPGFAKGGSVAAFQDGGAAFGVFPQMKPRRSRQDREAAKDVPLALARGAVSGVLGAPGDIESLIRLLPGLDESTTFLPTSEDVQRRLPLKSVSETPAGRAATNVGALAGGFYTGPGSPLRLVASVPGALRHGATEFAKASGQPTANVVKPEGGDWLKGAVQRGVSGLKKYDLPDLFPEIGAPPPNTPANEAINKWIGSNLGNYLQKQMATPSDPLRKLAEEGITHLPDLATRTAEFPTGTLRRERGRAGFPEFGMGQSELAKKWENLADEAIFTHRAGDIQKSAEVASKLDEVKAEYFDRLAEIDAKMAERLTSRGFNEDEAATMMRVMSPKQKAEMVGDDGFYAISRDYERAAIESQGPNAMIAKDNPWIAKLDPDAPAYHGDVYDLGFDHVVDVLGEMVASGRIRPEQLNKVSLEQAVRMTYQYDLDMAKKMAEAQIKATEGMPVYKEYPEGFRWVELAPPSYTQETLPPGFKLEQWEYKGKPVWSVVDEAGVTQNEAAGSAEDALKQFGRSEVGRKAVEDALKYEGSTMGHCVGGYCPDVMEGRSRIFSLRDAKGEPHVTIEVGRPESRFGMTAGDIDPYRERLRQQFPDLDEEKIYNMAVNEFTKDQTANLPERIVQIKGKQNRAPKEEYLPFVQDFVKSGQWSDVGDLRNTGLRDINATPALKKYLEGRNIGFDRFVPEETYKEFEDDFLMDRLYPRDDPRYAPPEGYNKGGSVKTGIKEGVNLARRSLFGLRPSQEMAGRELAPVQRDLDRMQAELNRAEKAAPKVEERSVTIDPGKGSAKVTDVVKKVAETPVSRRTVLKSAAGQVMQQALPASSFADLMKPVEVAKQAVQAAAPSYSLASVPGLVAKLMREGMTPEEAGRAVEKMVPNVLEKWPEMVAERIRAPAESMPLVDEGTPLMSIFGEMIKPGFQRGPYSLRPQMRELQRLSPEDYSALKETARDIKEYGFEP